MGKVFLTVQAQKDFKRITSKDRRRVEKKLVFLREGEEEGKKLAGKLKGFYSLRAWPYRIIYVLEGKEIWVVHIAHRQGAY